MKQGSNSRGRLRGRMGSGGSGGKRPPNRNQTFDSNGPAVRLRGNAMQLVEKYTTLARDTGSQGDRVLSENYLQHADHYYRVYMALTGQTDVNRPGAPQPNRANDEGEDDDSPEEAETGSGRGNGADDEGRDRRDRERSGKNGGRAGGRRPERSGDEITEGALSLVPGAGGRDSGVPDASDASDDSDAPGARGGAGRDAGDDESGPSVTDGVRATLGLDRAVPAASERNDGEEGAKQGEAAPVRRRAPRRTARTAEAAPQEGDGGESEESAEGGSRPARRGRRGSRRGTAAGGENRETGAADEGDSESRLL